MTRLGRAGEVITWSISLLAWGISYATQARLAASTGTFPTWEAWTWPATVDLASLAAMVLALDQARRGRSARVAWGIAILAAGVMVAANTAADWPSPLAMLMHAWPPIIALACWLLLVHDRRREPLAGKPSGRAVSVEKAQVPTLATEPSPGTEVTPPKPPRNRPLAQSASRKVDRSKAFQVIADHGGKLSGRKLAELLEVSHPTGTALLAEWKQNGHGGSNHGPSGEPGA